jgi:hypothetical protein
MASINYGAKEISVKIVYYGPGKSGKTTNLQVIHQKSPASNKSDMVSLATEKDRTIFFDFLPLSLGKVRGFDTKFQLYTVPGQVFYNSTRKLVLRGVDGVVFVADSAPDKQDENLESFHNLIENLKEHGYDFDTIPTILQYNKRDLPTAVDLATLDNALNTRGLSRTEAVAVKGTGVFETLKLIGKEVISALNTKYGTTGMHPLPRTGSLSRDAQTQQKPSAASPSQPRDAQAPPRQQQQPQQPSSQPQPHAAPQQPAPQKPQPQEPPRQPRPQQPQQPEQQPQQQSQSSAQAAEQRLSSPIEEATGTPQQPAAQSTHQPPEKPAEAPAGEQAPSAGPAAGQSQPAEGASDLSADADTYVDENSFEYPQDTSELDLEIQRYQREIEENKWKKNVDAAGTSKDTPPQPNAPATSAPSGETDTPRHPEAPPSAAPQQPSQQHPEEESASFEITDTNELVAQTQQSNTGTQSPGEKETEQPDEEDDSFDEEQTYYFTTSKKKRKSKGLFGRLFGK